MSRAIQILDEQVSIFDVARRYNLPWAGRDPSKPFQVLCPMHADSAPSCRIYGRSNSGYCWTCQKSFGPTTLVVTLEGCGYGQAIDLLSSWYGIDLTPDPDEDEARRLIALATGERRLTDEEQADLRRAAGASVRAVGLEWPAAQALLEVYDVLDLTDMDPADWLDLARASLS